MPDDLGEEWIAGLHKQIRGPDRYGRVLTFKAGDRVRFHTPDGDVKNDIVIGCFMQVGLFNVHEERSPIPGNVDVPACLLSKHNWAPTTDLEKL